VIVETIEMLAFPEGFDVSHPALPATGIPPSTVVSFGRTAANAQQQHWGAGSGPAGFPTGGPIPGFRETITQCSQEAGIVGDGDTTVPSSLWTSSLSSSPSRRTARISSLERSMKRCKTFRDPVAHLIKSCRLGQTGGAGPV
jgi:hypothetical protein